MSEWKELKIDNLPADILTGDYKFQWQRCTSGVWTNTDFYDDRYIIIKCLVEGSDYRYRKPEPKTPSHEGIQISNEAKDRITGNLFYLFHQFMTQEPLTKAIDIQHRLNLTRDAIANVLESADIPTEEK